MLKNFNGEKGDLEMIPLNILTVFTEVLYLSVHQILRPKTKTVKENIQQIGAHAIVYNRGIVY